MTTRFLLIAALIAVAICASSTERHFRIAVVAPAPYDGALMIEEPFEAQVGMARNIVVGRVTDVVSFKEPGTIKTRIQIEVEEYVKGGGPTALTLTVDGGSVGNETLDVGGVPRFVSGERVLLLLDGSTQPKLLNRWQSKFSLAGTQAFQTGERRSQSIRALEQSLSSALGAAVDIPEDNTEITSLAFATYCAPWSTASLPVVFEVNPTSPGSGGPTGANFSRLSYESWHAWQALGNSYPSFSYGGTTSRDGSNHSDGFNTIAWASDLGSGTLGVNWCATSGGVRYDSDTLLNNVDFNWDADDSNGISSTSYSLQSVMEHELGHGLGMGHSDQTCNGSASTPLMCPAISNGVRKVILADDQAGAASIYPLSGGAPGTPSNLNLTQGSGSNSLTWNASSGSPLAYDIERSDANCSGWKPVGTVKVTSFVDNDFGGGLAAGSNCYRVKALGVGGDSGWSNTATATTDVPGTVSVSPDDATIAPMAPVSFDATYSHTGGWAELDRVDLVVGIDYSQAIDGCWVLYRVDLNHLYLRSDTGSYVDAGAPGSGSTVANSRCRLLAGSSSVSTNGDDEITVSFRLQFKDAFIGTHNLILRAHQTNDPWSAPAALGTVSVSNSGEPGTVSVSPAGATVAPMAPTSFDATYSHTGGWAELDRVDLVAGVNYSQAINGCWVLYRVDLNRLYLRSEAGAYVDAGAPGSGSTVANSRCRLLAGSSSVSTNGDEITVSFRLQFKDAFIGTHNLILRAHQLNGPWSDSANLGTVAVEDSGEPGTVSVSPSGATVAVMTPISFDATYSHTGGWAELDRVDLVAGVNYSQAINGCWVLYRVDLNRLYLRSDTGAYLDAGAPGSGSTVANSRCRLLAGSSSVSTNGDEITVSFRLQFKDAFIGTRNLILRAHQMNGPWSDSATLGTVTVE